MAFQELMEGSSSNNQQLLPDSGGSRLRTQSSSFFFDSRNRPTYTTRNVPRKRIDPSAGGNIYSPLVQIVSYKPRGRRDPMEAPYIHQYGGQPFILNITNVDPQRWNNYLDSWKNAITSDYIKYFDPRDTEEMLRYLEQYLGESAKAMW
ncbi:hypothetical protein ACH5RR_020171 [Cinchona calisaya]|uniref:Uncharacterized protein n=1 Tax=Cinchona calisaya TaxID=153742 RepID=A0ABD2ZGN8_9GENT